MDGGEDPQLAPAQWAPVATPDEIARFAATAGLGTGLLTPFGVLDPSALSDAGRIDALVGVARLQAWAAAQEQRLLAAMAPTADVMEAGFLADEIGCALRLSPTVVRSKLAVAADLVERLPATLASLESGAISERHARVVDEAVGQLDDPRAAQVEAQVLPRAPRQTPAAFRSSVHRAVLAVDPRDAHRRHEDAMQDRRVCVRPVEDGMAELWALLPADGAATVRAALNAGAAGKTASDERSVDQRTGRRAGRAGSAAADRPRPADPARPAAECAGQRCGYDVARTRRRSG